MPYLVPSSAREALDLLQQGQPRVIAGCTDYFPSMPAGQSDPHLVDISRIPDLQGVVQTDQGWRIGAAATWTDVLNAPLPPAFDGLKLAAREVGSIQIQNRGTLAGNICNASPAADGVPPLLALDACVEVSSTQGTRMVPLDAFITGVRQTNLSTGEMVTALHIPRVSTTATSAFLKLGSRTHMVISIAMVAAVVETQGDRISRIALAVGSCAPVAQRLTNLESALCGVPVSDIADWDFSAPAYLAPLTPISDVRGSSDYRLDVVPELCKRAVLRAVEKD